MGKLSHIRADMTSQSMIDGIAKSVGDYIAAAVVATLQEDMSRGSDGLSGIKAAVEAVEPALRAALKSATETVTRSVTAQQAALKSDIAATTKQQQALQSKLIAAMEGIRIPDYSADLRRLESKQVDLEPISRQVQAVLLKLDTETDERPRTWTFEVIRHKKSNLIERVIATAESPHGDI